MARRPRRYLQVMPSIAPGSTSSRVLSIDYREGHPPRLVTQCQRTGGQSGSLCHAAQQARQKLERLSTRVNETGHLEGALDWHETEARIAAWHAGYPRTASSNLKRAGSMTSHECADCRIGSACTVVPRLLPAEQKATRFGRFPGQLRIKAPGQIVFHVVVRHRRTADGRTMRASATFPDGRATPEYSNWVCNATGP